MMDSKDADTATSNTETEDSTVDFSIPLAVVLRYLLPVALLLLSANYIRETFGQIRTQNLVYPYLIIGLMTILIVAIMIEEAVDLRAADITVDTRTTIKQYVTQWRIPIVFAGLLVVYAVLIPTIGFFSASVAFMTASMYITSVRDRKVGAAVVGGTLVLIWILFVEIVGVSPPEGVIDRIVLELIPII